MLLASAWLLELAGSRGLYAAALASGTVDIDPILLSALHAFTGGRVDARSAAAAIALAYAANMVFKFGVLCWYNRRLALASSWPMAATLAGGAAAFAARV